METYHHTEKNSRFMPFEIGYLPEKIRQKAELELHETDGVRETAILQLRSLLKEETKLYCPDNDEYLLQYLRARKFDVMRAFSLLKNYHVVKRKYSELYSKMDSVGLRMNMDNKIINCLPIRDEEGCAIIICKIGNWKTDKMGMGTFVQALTAAVLLTLQDPVTQVCGVKLVMDLKGFSLKHLRNVSPRYLHLFSSALQNCLPCRFKAVHILNESVLFQYIWSVLRIFLSEKMKDRFYFHGENRKTLHKLFPSAILPVEYGGKNSSLDNRWWAEKMRNFEDTFNEFHKYGYLQNKDNFEE